jgi:hypothetical protein
MIVQARIFDCEGFVDTDKYGFVIEVGESIVKLAAFFAEKCAAVGLCEVVTNT